MLSAWSMACSSAGLSSVKSRPSTMSLASVADPPVARWTVHSCWTAVTCSMKPLVSSVRPWPSDSKTCHTRPLSPKSRKEHSQKPSGLSTSSAVASASTAPSTVRVTTLLDLYFFSSSMTWVAKGPSWKVQAIFCLSHVMSTARASPLRKCDSVACPTDEVTSFRSLETSSSTFGLGTTPMSRLSLLGSGGGVGLAKKCVTSSPLSMETVAFMGSAFGTVRMMLLLGTTGRCFEPAASRMFSGLTAG
mmetsp:Transcript_132319/g.411305  ORF Transcript_132319/g.411305 Transcript_132319/m.411305 type:complete len:247 (-) Transcript_132319:552-1292(-)